MNRAQPRPIAGPVCERGINGANCTKGPGGTAAEAVEQVDGTWYCRGHLPAAKAIAAKRRDRGLGICSVAQCSRPAVEIKGKCSEHRAGERAVGGTVVIVEAGSGRGDHPYAPKRAELYLALFRDLGLLKIGKATPWTVARRVKVAADKLRVRQVDSGVEQPITCGLDAWTIALFGSENVLWAVSERVEHAAAGRLAHNVGATSVVHTEGKEWLRHDRIADIDWPTEFHRAVSETLVFLGHGQTHAGQPRLVKS